VRVAIPPLLREPEFRRFWSAQGISQLGDQISLLALPLAAVLVLHAGPAQMGLLTAAALAPHLLLSLGAGAWVDRRARRRRVMIVSDLGRAAVLATVPLTYAFGALTLAQLYAVAFAHGVFSVFFEVAYPTVFVSKIERHRLLDASGLLSTNRALSFVSGPSVAGVLVQALSAPVTLLVDAVSFLGSAFFLSQLRSPEPPVEPEGEVLLRTRLLQGFRFILSSRTYTTTLFATSTLNLFNYMFHALFVLYATRSLHVRPGTLGLVLGVAAVGGILGAVVAAPLGRRIGVGPAYALGSFAFPAPLVLVPLAGGPHALVLAMLFAAEFLSSIGVMILDINGNSINVAITPDRLRARVTGAHRFVNYGVRPIGSLLGGAFGAWFGLQTTLWAGTIGGVAALLWLVPSPILGIKDLPAEAAERVPA
jgi:MFS family permease